MIISCIYKIPEYCKSVDEKEVFAHAFELLSAFDEIVALGYKESVNLGQIRTYTDMDSHDERVHDAMRLVRLIAHHFSHIKKKHTFFLIDLVSRT